MPRLGEAPAQHNPVNTAEAVDAIGVHLFPLVAEPETRLR